MTQLRDRTVWITGASSGIGEALAVSAVRDGARVIISARREAELQRVKAACADSGRVAVLPVDLLDFDPAEVARKAAGFFGPIDVLVNNAGCSQRSFIAETDLSVYRRIMELDFFAPVALLKACLPDLRAQRGHVVMIGSIVSRIGTPRRSGYAAAKHALMGFTESATAEFAKEGVRFTFVMPGYVRTQVSMAALTGDGQVHGQMDPATDKGMTADYCARRIWSAVAADRETIAIGFKETAFLYLKLWAPRLMSWALKRVETT